MSIQRPVRSVGESPWGQEYRSRLADLLDLPGLARDGALRSDVGTGAVVDIQAELARRGPLRLSVELLDHLAALGLTAKELALVLPPRTLAHRRAKGQTLSPAESDRALRLARLLVLAESVFGDRDKALRWLRKPLARFESQSALDLMASEIGGRLVEETLIQIDEGYAA